PRAHDAVAAHLSAREARPHARANIRAAARRPGIRTPHHEVAAVDHERPRLARQPSRPPEHEPPAGWAGEGTLQRALDGVRVGLRPIGFRAPSHRTSRY